ncbi:hypothetical protein Tcan_00131 [Toxocara canis]|uniref:7TM GPCR serpentine receptor class x (Srx) domain-containing protein n=1 Tax=Toxocara canis TaxID=6265 RepID=A0A0B2UQ54_TOXCA|nr:hypothetical protein Tcan_00131 [Toxocara canis]
MALNLVLAINRFFVLCYEPKIASRKFYIVLCICCHVYSGILFILYLTPYPALTFNVFVFTWTYLGSAFGITLKAIESICVAILLMTALIIYIVIVICLLRTVSSELSNSVHRKINTL